jgi:hypothetical protein
MEKAAGAFTIMIQQAENGLAPNRQTDPLVAREGRSWLLNTLLEARPENIERHCNIRLPNLLCRPDCNA